MDALLNRVLDAAGGRGRWARIRSLRADLSVGGSVWAAKGWPDGLPGMTVTADTRRQHIVITPLTATGLSAEFDNATATALDGTGAGPQRVVLRDTSGRVVEELIDPRAAFTGLVRLSPWDAPRLGYFLGYALWNYLTTPLLLARPDVLVREIEPWPEAGQTWRRLRVTYPPTLATHSADQTFYYDADGLQRRMDYVNEVMGSSLVAHYTGHHRRFDGLVVPTRRRIFRRNPDGIADLSLTSITIDVHRVVPVTDEAAPAAA
ncbi:hypothetical protein ACFYXS_38935 [Streptomyces sp. NPDC002574]|uniref:hypothetical protein n=1 Tax=Streptomyces sp. NPDC002574 TaxID=3364652 RepID=UPI0036CBFEE1